MAFKNLLAKKRIKQQQKLDHAFKAIWERIGWYTVVVDVSFSSLKWGTGSLITFRNRKFVLTCEHIVERKTRKSLDVIYRPNEPLEFSENKDVPKKIPESLLKKARPRNIPIVGQYYGDKQDDLALFEIERTPLISDIDFYPLPDNPSGKAYAGGVAYLTGFAAELARKVGSRQAGVFGYNHVEEIVYKKISSEDFSRKKHFLINYPTQGPYFVEPQCLSGAGVWSRRPAGRKNLWTPNLFLIGVQQSFYRQSQVLKVTRIERLYCLINNI